jgi:8-hydroxy-5-deazaflavin:NADPH oxidoreductase
VTTSVADGMRIAVIGVGKVGGTLGQRWLDAGHQVVYGSRHPAAQGPGGAPVRAVPQALDGADAVLLAVPDSAVAGVVAEHAAGLDGKLVIDATNRIGAGSVNAHAEIAQAAPQARYVRAFNTLGWENFADPLPGSAMFYAADPAAVDVAEQLITAVGLDPVLVGDAGAAGTVDGLLMLWFALVRQHGGNRRLALRVLT